MVRESFPNFFKVDVLDAIDRTDNVASVAKLYHISPKIAYNWINNEEKIRGSDPIATKTTRPKMKKKPNPKRRWDAD